MIYGYIRVSTDRQTLENQRYEITRFCEQNNCLIDGWIQETISGTKSADKRKLGELLEIIKKGDLIVCAELSRLGRSLFMIMNILNTCMEKECRVWTIKEGYRLGDDIQSKVLAFAFGMAAEIERQLISARTKEALERRKAQGLKLGRPKGRSAQTDILDNHYEAIRASLRNGVTKTAIAKQMKCSRTTLYSWLASNNLIAQKPL
jgi:DNA invertase Pin-like site-specific DNA recombinase